MKNIFKIQRLCYLIIFVLFNSGILNAQSFTATISVSYDDPNQCAGYGVFLVALPDDISSYTFSWSCPGGICPPSWDTIDATAAFFPTNDSLGNGIYSIIITEIATGATSSASIQVNNYPVPTVGLSGNDSGCEGTTTTIIARDHTHGLNQYGPYTYDWSGGLSSSDSSIYTFGPDYSFIEGVTVINSFGCTGSNNSFYWLWGSPTPQVTVSANGNTVFCAGDSVELVGLATHPTHGLQNLTYQWLKYGNTLSDMDSSFFPKATGRYRLIASESGCADTSNYIDVLVNPLPTVTVNPSGSVGYCVGQLVNLLATSPTATSYQWKRNGNILAGQVSNSLSVSTAGKYKAVVQDVNGCVRASAPIEVVGPPNNQVSASGPLTFCQGGSVTFTAAAGYSYQWKKRTNGNYVDIPLATNQSYTATVSGKYKVFVTNNSTGCTVSSAAKTVNVNCRLAGESNVALEVEVYPNPFQSQITLSLPDEWNESITVMLYDLSGRLVYQLESATLEGSELDLPVANLKNGTYMLQVIVNGEQFKRVIVKN